MREKQPANKLLDFFLGWFGLFGLIVEAIRNSDNHISWWAFIMGWVSTWVALILLVILCVALIATTDEAISELDDQVSEIVIGTTGATAAELDRACEELSRVGYDYWQLSPLSTSGRTLEVAAAIHTAHPGPEMTRQFCIVR